MIIKEFKLNNEIADAIKARNTATSIVIVCQQINTDRSALVHDASKDKDRRIAKLSGKTGISESITISRTFGGNKTRPLAFLAFHDAQCAVFAKFGVFPVSIPEQFHSWLDSAVVPVKGNGKGKGKGKPSA